MEKLRLVNSKIGLSSDYVPKHLIQDSFSKIWICSEVLHAFRRLGHRLCACGLEPLVLVSGYRSYSYQQMLYDKKTKVFLDEGLEEEDARKRAAHIVAVPGHSEHQLGLAIDVTICSMKALKDPLIEDFEQTPTGQWMCEESHKEGFILRYPRDKVAITGITYEPWHYRYVGIKAAGQMKRLNMCLEEYLLLRQD